MAYGLRLITFMNKFFRFLSLVTILTLCWYLGRYFEIDLEHYQGILDRYPKAVSGFFFIFLYVFVTFFVWFGAKDMFRIASALLYGPLVSAILVYLAELGNAAVLFNLSRHLGRDFVVQRFGLDKKDLERSERSSGFFGAFTLRINPLIPFRFQDLAAGLTAIPLQKYLGAIALAQIPRILFFQYVIAGVGMSIFKNPDQAMQYMIEHEEIILFGNLYFFLIVLTTLAFIINKGLQKKRATNA
jgi:uncharacterized membrane protein YdjX (TVP38/TMEM64 family)